jgi:predicted small metal-binding protein
MVAGDKRECSFGAGAPRCQRLGHATPSQPLGVYISSEETRMKTMTCEQLGGACNKKFQAESFDEIAELSKQHGMEMAQKKDKAHLEAMNRMRARMEKPETMREWFESKRKEFNGLPDD